MHTTKLPLIAIIDDSKFLREELSSLLNKKGFIVSLLAENGKDLLDQLENIPELPDLCICDINMPVMNGFETAKAVKAKYPQIKFLSFSTDSSSWIQTEALRSGADAFIPKHSTIQEYMANIVQLIPYARSASQEKP